MISDTLADAISSIETDLEFYKTNNDTYEYPPEIFDFIAKLIEPLKTVQFKLDAGCDISDIIK